MEKCTFLQKDYWLVALLGVGCAITYGGWLPKIVYLALALTCALYFFPVRLFLVERNERERLKRVLYLVQHLVLGATMILSGSLVIVNNSMLELFFTVFLVLNIGLLFFWYAKEGRSYSFWVSACLYFFALPTTLV